MRTDKQLLRIFKAAPEWIFELTGLPSPGASPLTVVEFQFQKDTTVYPRIVVEMALLQQSHQMRPIQGLIFFG